MAELKTTYLDDILDVSTNERRKYQQITNDDGTVSFVDVTDYTQVGDSFGAKDINSTNGAINNLFEEKQNLLDDLQTLIEDLYPKIGYIEHEASGIRISYERSGNVCILNLSGTNTSGGTYAPSGYVALGTLPKGYRPQTKQTSYTGIAIGYLAALTVETSGVVAINHLSAGISSGYGYVGQISFIVA